MSSSLAEAMEWAGLTLFERGWLSSNCLLFTQGNGDSATLVDSGYWSHQEQTIELVRRALGPARLERIVNTHLHSDHCGGNAALQKVFDCKVEVPEGEHAKVGEWDETRLTYRATGQHCPRFRSDSGLRSGSHVVLAGRNWQVHASPGHDPESVVLYEPDLRVLVSADALWEDGFGVVFPELEGLDAFSQVHSTLEMIAKLKVDWVIPGHGRAFGDVARAIDRAAARLERFVADPRRHAAHAAKVLIKFHVLEVQQESLEELFAWLEHTAYFDSVHRTHFGNVPMQEWRLGLLESLARSGAIDISQGRVRNH